jgi:hypothetical protein
MFKLKEDFCQQRTVFYRRGQYIYNRVQYIYKIFCKRGHYLQRKHCVSEECSEFTGKGSLASEGKFCIFTEEDGICMYRRWK